MSRSTKRKRRLAVAVSACTAMIVMAAQTAQAAPGARDSAAPPAAGSFVRIGSHEVRSSQTILSMQLQAFARTHQLSGYAGAALQADGTTVRLFWAGAVPSQLTEWIHANAGNRVELTRVSMSADELGARAKSLLTRATRLGIPVIGAGATADFRGIHVDILSTATAAQRSTLRRLGATEIAETAKGMTPLSGRQGDTTPFYGGAAITNSSKGNCSTGFAVTKSSGAQAMVTANHCGTGVSWKTPSGTTVGTSGSGNTSVDAMLLTGQSYTGTIYTGTYTASTSAPVYGAYDPQVGDSVCASGAYSGQVCGAKVTKANYYANGRGPGFTANTSGYTALAGPGDSGGPAYETAGSGVLIDGMISAGIDDDGNTCHGAKRDGCFWNVFFIYPIPLMSALNVTIMDS